MGGLGDRTQKQNVERGRGARRSQSADTSYLSNRSVSSSSESWIDLEKCSYEEDEMTETPLLNTTQTTIPDIILFGDGGSGKSSVVNMLSGSCVDAFEPAAVSSLATVSPIVPTKSYDKDISGRLVRVHDTPSLDQSTNFTPPTPKKSDVPNLLVYVTRATRLTNNAQSNYANFLSNFRRRKRKVVVIVTGLEEQEDMSSWWDINRSCFEDAGMYFEDAACITATKGKFNQKTGSFLYQEEYDASRIEVEGLLARALGL